MKQKEIFFFEKKKFKIADSKNRLVLKLVGLIDAKGIDMAMRVSNISSKTG